VYLQLCLLCVSWWSKLRKLPTFSVVTVRSLLVLAVWGGQPNVNVNISVTRVEQSSFKWFCSPSHLSTSAVRLLLVQIWVMLLAVLLSESFIDLIVGPYMISSVCNFCVSWRLWQKSCSTAYSCAVSLCERISCLFTNKTSSCNAADSGSVSKYRV
jgi:hypothetical protein